MKTRQTSVINRPRKSVSTFSCHTRSTNASGPPGPSHVSCQSHSGDAVTAYWKHTYRLTKTELKILLAGGRFADTCFVAGSNRTSVLYGSGTVPIVLLDTSGWSPGTALAWTFCPGSKTSQPWPGKSSQWVDSSHSAQRTPHSCTFFHCQERRQV